MRRIALILLIVIAAVVGVDYIVSTGRTPPAPSAAPWFLSGQVRSEGGGPLAGATVHAYIRTGSVVAWRPEVTTDADGAYRIDISDLAAWTRVRRTTAEVSIQAHADGYVQDWVNDVRLDKAVPGVAVVHDLALVPGARVQGRVVDANGRPWVRAVVTLSSTARNDDFADFSGTDARGHFVIGASGAGPFRLEVASFEDDVESAAVSFSLGGRSTLLLDDIVMDAEATIEGRVVNRQGKGLEDVTVYAEVKNETYDFPATSSARTDAEGRFRLDVRKGKEYLVLVETLVGTGAHAYCRAGDQDVVLTVDAARLVVHAVDEAGHALHGADIDLSVWPPEHAALLDALMAGEVDPAVAHAKVRDGSMGMLGKSPQTYLVERGAACHLAASVAADVEPAPGTFPSETVVTLRPDQDVAEVSLVVRGSVPEGMLDLALRRPDGSAVRTFGVDVRTLSGVLLTTVFSDKEGRLPSIPAGRVRLTVAPMATTSFGDQRQYYAGYELALRRVVDVPEGGTLPLALAVREGARLQVGITWPGGKRPKGEWVDVNIVPLDDTAAPVMTLERWNSAGAGRPGTNRFDSVDAYEAAPLFEPGAYRLTIRTRYEGTHTQRLELAAGKTSKVTFDLRR